ncbi:MAG TPA: EAL domain-containing protein [Thermoanaerobaculia bacterium]|jgi:diguanylate cyclase (GGDEF)-like protein/PAS domain S-box-containing protein|nr:EAL domain-containing protein [Thermoanaerobaculia bacterium]
MEVQPPPHLANARSALARWLRGGRTRASHESLRTTVAILRAQQEATLDGILVVDDHGSILSYNRRFLEMWGIPEETAKAADDNELLGFASEKVQDWDEFIELVNHLYTNPTAVRSNDTVYMKDGRVLSRASVPIVSGQKVRGRAWYFRDVTETVRNERMQAALFRIATLSREASNLDEFYGAVHSIVNGLMEATYFYIAEYDAARDILTFPYFVDKFDEAPVGRPPGRGLTAYVLRTGKPLLATPKEFDDLKKSGEVESIGAPSVDWLGAPLATGDRTWGVIGVQTYDEGVRYTDRDRDLLVFVAQHVASAVEQKRQEDALRESERRYRQMFQNNRAVQILLDPASGRIVDANMAAAEFYGWSVETLRSMYIWQINMLDEGAIRSEMTNASQQRRSYFVFRHRLASADVRDVEVHSGPIVSGGRTLLYSIIHDITERKRAEEALLLSEQKYRNIVDYASVGIYRSTPDGTILMANPALARILGYDSTDDLQDRNLATDIYVTEGDRQIALQRFAANGFAIEDDLQWRRKDGTPIWVQLNAHAIDLQEGAEVYEGFVFDITERKLADQQIAAANAQRKAVLDAATRVSIIATDARGVVTVFNSGAERMLGYAASDVIGARNITELHLDTELVQHARRLAFELGEKLSGFDVLVRRATREGLEEREWTYIGNDGEPVTVLLSVTALRDEHGNLTGYLHVGTDVTERKHAEETLRQQSAAMTASMDGIGILDGRLDFTYVNDALAKLFGYPTPQEIIGRSLCDLYEPPEQVRFITTIVPLVQQRGRWRGEATGLRHDASLFPQEISLTSIEGGGMVCVVRDITERTYAEEQIKHLAYHDALTTLPNRLLFKDRVTVAISHAQRHESRVSVLFLDLDRFKVINDSLGHNIGDQLLQAVAARVQSCVRDSDTVARLGGDEFTLLLPELTHAEDAALVAQKILEAVRYPFHIEGREFYITTSIGISVFPEDGPDAETLIKSADTAMYQAKEQGRDNYQLFNALVNAKALQRIALEHGLRRCLSHHELAVHYQPIFDLRTGRITGMEALLRWTDPELGAIPPATFIPLAEAIGVMIPIGTWALRVACAQAKQWHDSGFDTLSLAVNLSVCQLQQPDLVNLVREILAETGLPARNLELEITESTAMQSPEASLRTLYELKRLGIRISLDDFGTGHSSLAYLKRFPIDTLKIDQSFIRDITRDPDTAAIVTAIIAMGHSLRLKVIAEGVEFTDQATFLKRHDCDQMQGYLINAPMPAAELGAILAAGDVRVVDAP